MSQGDPGAKVFKWSVGKEKTRQSRLISKTGKGVKRRGSEMKGIANPLTRCYE